VPDVGDETNSERLSFRTTKSNWQKLVSIAKSLRMLNGNGRPNISAVLNYMIDKFELKGGQDERE
jgi:hypothetical protein